MKFFNTAGPIVLEEHYNVPIDKRIDLDEIMMLIEQKKYFVLHAPRQSGKTTGLLGLMNILNETGKYKCLYVNVESAQAARENVNDAMKAILKELADSEKHYLNENIIERNNIDYINTGAHNALASALTQWTKESDKPTILLIDEIDSLIGDSLISVLRQIRGRYAQRPTGFPQSIILCGVRDVRDYRIHSSESKEIITGGSYFNINAESLRIGNFNEIEISELFMQHTKETGQKFEEEVTTLVYNLTSGQPWLVNALAYEVCFKTLKGKDRNNNITKEMILGAKENIIKRRDTHLDQLADKLKENRVRSIIEPMIKGEDIQNVPIDDIDYCIDLGLIKNENGKLEISNLIYKEVVPRELSYVTQLSLGSSFEPLWYVNEDNTLNIEKILGDYQQFFRENSESWIERFDYKEAGPQLLLQAFLQRVVNGGGRIYREYGLARGRTDLMIEWKDKTKFIIELKILHKSLDKTIEKGLEQIWKYMDKVGADVGNLMIFDRRESIIWDEKIFKKERVYKGKKVIIWGM